jgi:hypothetical protein
MSYAGLSSAQKKAYDRDGFVILPKVFTHAECDKTIQHMFDIQSGKVPLAGYDPSKNPEMAGRLFNPHHTDALSLHLLLHPRLRKPLEDAIDDQRVDAVQTMYFFKGSQQARHQDQYYLPGCFSAWCAQTDVGPDNGTIWVQVGSHKGRLITQKDMVNEKGEPLGTFGKHYDDAVQAEFEKNGMPEVPVEAKKGDVVIFDGKLIHRGGPIGVPGSFRHVMANHYIPYDFDGWPYADWLRYSFDDEKRLTKNGVTQAV